MRSFMEDVDFDWVLKNKLFREKWEGYFKLKEKWERRMGMMVLEVIVRSV